MNDESNVNDDAIVDIDDMDSEMVFGQPTQVLNSITSHAKLILYLNELVTEVRNKSISVENPSTEDFIEAAGAWLEGAERFLEKLGEDPPIKPTWSLIAMVFTAGLIYE